MDNIVHLKEDKIKQRGRAIFINYVTKSLVEISRTNDTSLTRDILYYCRITKSDM